MIHVVIAIRLCLDVCIGRLGIVFIVISTFRDIGIDINTNISVWMFRYLVPRIGTPVECQILFGWSQ
jgi:hypothetical protein